MVGVCYNKMHAAGISLLWRRWQRRGEGGGGDGKGGGVQAGDGKGGCVQVRSFVPNKISAQKRGELNDPGGMGGEGGEKKKLNRC